jgi:hypothetical protein
VKTFIALCLLVSCPALCTCVQQRSARPSKIIIYELYSWRDSNGEWCFSILPNTNRADTVEDIFDKKETIRGIAKLKERISKMSRTTELVWEKNPWAGTPVKGTESVTLPPEETMNEVKRFAATKHIEVVWSR